MGAGISWSLAGTCHGLGSLWMFFTHCLAQLSHQLQSLCNLCEIHRRTLQCTSCREDDRLSKIYSLSQRLAACECWSNPAPNQNTKTFISESGLFSHCTLLESKPCPNTYHHLNFSTRSNYSSLSPHLPNRCWEYLIKKSGGNNRLESGLQAARLMWLWQHLSSSCNLIIGTILGTIIWSWNVGNLYSVSCLNTCMYRHMHTPVRY